MSNIKKNKIYKSNKNFIEKYNNSEINLSLLDNFDYFNKDSFIKDLDNYLNNDIEDNKICFTSSQIFGDDIILDNSSEFVKNNLNNIEKIDNTQITSNDQVKVNDDNLKKKSKIICNIIDNKKEGKAKQIFSNDNILKFTYKNNIRQGKAMLIMKDGVINFNYKNDKKHGLCKIIMLNGTSMTFNFNNGIKDGKAFIKKSSGDMIVFSYKNNKMDDEFIKKYKIDNNIDIALHLYSIENI